MNLWGTFSDSIQNSASQEYIEIGKLSREVHVKRLTTMANL
jgi:hypothetical protein